MISTVLEAATIIDGSGRPGYKTDVAFSGNTIALVGDCSDREARRRLDCRGKIVTPGFIDTCSHTGQKWITNPSAGSKTNQGILREITALSCDSFEKNWAESLNVTDVLDLARSDARGAFVSIFVTTDVRLSVERGACGVAVDLDTHGLDDAVALAREAALAGSPRALVTLDDDDSDVLASVETAIEIARRATVHVHISNHHVISPRSSANMERTLEAIDRARTRGASITIDVAPYVATWITLASLLPAHVTPSMLQDDALAAAVAVEMQARLGERWHDLMLAEVGSEQRMEWCGMRIDDIARQTWRSPARTIVDFIRDEGERARAFWFCLQEDDVATALSADFCTIGTAAPAMRVTDHPYGLVHPRTFGTFPRIFGRFVRQRRTLTMVEAVRRMTSLPASIFGLEGQGTLEPDAPADVVVFDEDAFVDTATYERPFSLPVGLRHVFRSGAELAVSGGPA